MYTQTNNRIITKYADFLKEQEVELPDFVPPSITKHVNDPFFSPHDLIQEVDSDSGRESPTAHTSSTMTVTSAEVHNIIESDGESSDPSALPLTLLLPSEHFTSSKFSDLFTPAESHALFQRDLFIQSEEGSFLKEAEEARRAPGVDSSSGGGHPVDTPVVTQNDLSSDIREGHLESRSSSVVHTRPNKLRTSLPPLQAAYPPSPAGSSSLAETEVSLRRELLNNIRAISRATFFEKLYTGNTKSRDGLDFDLAESSDTNNNPSTIVANEELEALLRAESPAQTLVVSEKGEFLVFEAQSPRRSEGSKVESRDALDVNGLAEVTERDKESSIHQWILNSRHDSEAEAIEPDTLPGDHEGGSVHEVPGASVPEVAYYSSPEIPSPKGSYNADRQEPIPADVASSHDSVVPLDHVSSDGHPDSDIPPSSASSVAKQKPKHPLPACPPHVSKMVDSSDSSRFTPMFSRVELDGDSKKGPVILQPRRHLLPPAPPSKNLTYSVLSPLTKQVRYPSALPKRLSPPIINVGRKNGRFRGNLPVVLLRTNMDQWVAKIVRFYVNGDEHLPRFEYRFRPGRDVHSFEGLCDILSERLKLTCGVRHIFTLEGRQICSLDELRHESAYVVSSTKKFKALNYGGELVEVEGTKGGGQSKRRGRSRPPSAPTNRNPPIIRVRRERSLNGVVWGSPQQDWSSGSERNTRPHLEQSTIEAEKVLRAAIEESQAASAASSKQIIRIINGSDPTIQSQVLLNTRVSQEFQELVKDLGLAVKIPRAVTSRMETLTGRAIQSYSQLRSHLKAGNEAFYIYNLNTNPSNSTARGHGQGAHLGLPDRTSPFGALSKSVSNPTLGHLETSLGKKFPNSIIHITPGTERSMESKRLHVPGVMNKSSSSSSIYHAEISQGILKGGQTKVKDQNSILSSSHPNLHQKRKSLRERYETSKYLVHHTSRSPSP